MSDFSANALILIDLQNDFLPPSGSFPISEQSLQPLKGSVLHTVTQFRALGGQIIWIKSNYAPATEAWKMEVSESARREKNCFADQGDNILSPGTENETNTQTKEEWVIEGTHLGKKPCCLAGTRSAELMDWVIPLQQPEDAVVIKTFYSAFKRSNLRRILDERGLDKIYLAGLLSNMCVLATALDAAIKQKGLQVSVITSCLGWRREESHLKALEIMRQYDVRLIRDDELVPDKSNNTENSLPQSSEV